MTNLFAKLIISGRRTIDEVKEKDKAKVIARLKELGYDENGDKIEVLYERTNDNV